MWVKLVLLFQFVILSSSSSLRIENNGASGVVSVESESYLPNIWEDEAVNRMVREMLARNLFHEHEHRRMRRQYKRDIHSSIASSSTIPSVAIARAATKTTRKSGATQKTKKPSKVTQAGNKNKNRVTTTVTTKATVKPNAKPIVSTTTATNFGSVNASSKIKVREFFIFYFPPVCSHNDRITKRLNVIMHTSHETN